MHPEIPAQSVSKELLELPSTPVGSAYRFRLAGALRGSTEPIQGVDRSLLTAVIDLPLPHTWSSPLRPKVPTAPGPFIPKFTTEHGRSFLPDDLRPEDEAPLRALAIASANPFVRGAIFDVLWVRFRTHGDARQAVDARAAAALLVELESAWFQATTEVVRACTLALEVGDRDRIRDVIQPTVERLAHDAVACGDPAAFVGVANDLAYPILLHKKVATTAKVLPARWAGTSLLAAGLLRGRGDHHRAEDALLVAAELFAGAGLQETARRVRSEHVAWLLERAQTGDGMQEAHLVQLALEESTRWGLSELASTAKSRLRTAVARATGEMKAIHFTLSLPTAIAAAIKELALRVQHLPTAVRSLAAAPWLSSLPLVAFQRAAEEEAASALFLHMMPSSAFRDGKVASLASTSEEKQREAMARFASIHLGTIELAAEQFLAATFTRFEPQTLFETVGNPPWMGQRALPWLLLASERFAAQDFASCAALVIPQYEGVLRDWARASGYHATKYDDGLTQDETLNSLLRVESVRSRLGEEHASFIEYLLCRPEMGPNLRNELAHGNLDARSLQPALVFLVWILLTRLALLDPTQKPESAGD
jgi:hypothetical protein